MNATIQHLIADLRAKEVLIPYQLHEGLRQLTQGFGGDYDYVGGNNRTADFLERYVRERRPNDSSRP